MRPVGNRLRARTIGLAFVAAFVAFEALFALRTGSAGIPGLFLINLADESGRTGTTRAETHHGGESVIAKLPEPANPPRPAAEEVTGSTSSGDGETRLEGLGEIPLKPWVRDDAESERTRSSASVPAGGTQAGEKLPWDAVEPVPFGDVAAAPSQDKAATPEAPRPQSRPAELQAEAKVAAWVKAKATEVKGIERARPLYHFEFWLEAPEGVRGSLASVAYEFNTPAVMPQSQMSREKETGFRVSAGGLVCADKVTVTLRFRDGRSQRVEVDGCKLVS
jgi:hypothetical protein